MPYDRPIQDWLPEYEDISDPMPSEAVRGLARQASAAALQEAAIPDERSREDLIAHYPED